MKIKALMTLTSIVCIIASFNLNLFADESDTIDSGEEAITKQQHVDERLNALEAQLRQLEAQLRRLEVPNLRPVDELLTNEIPSIRSRPLDDFLSRTLPVRDDATKGFIGVYLGHATDAGVPITRVIEGSPASIANILADDVITRIGDVSVAELDDPIASTVELINANPPGSIIQIKLLRGDEEILVDIATVRRSSIDFDEGFSNQARIFLSDLPERLNTQFQTIIDRFNNTVFVMDIEKDLGRYFGVENGVLVLEAEEVEGIQPGDVLLKVDDRPIRTVAQAIREVRAGEEQLTLLVKRNKREKSVTLEKNEFRLRSILD